MEKNKIKLSVMAEGEELGFMKNSDIYSLFGNALHNAMESLVAVADEDKRLIRMYVRKKGNMIVIHCENYCEKIEFGKDGLPKTDKQGGGHGYGMRSMRMIAEKYGGFIAVSHTDGMFYLDMLIPIITKEERKTD
jgi:sensor histidine kinase regulating citrate/malate metabolism